MVLEDPLHRDNEQVPQRKLAVVGSLWALLKQSTWWYREAAPLLRSYWVTRMTFYSRKLSMCRCSAESHHKMSPSMSPLFIFKRDAFCWITDSAPPVWGARPLSLCRWGQARRWRSPLDCSRPRRWAVWTHKDKESFLLREERGVLGSKTSLLNEAAQLSVVIFNNIHVLLFTAA